MSPLRFRLAYLRVQHHIIDIGYEGESRWAIGSSCLRAAMQKRWLNRSEQHWKSLLARYFEKTAKAYLGLRRAEELPHHLISVGSLSTFTALH